MFSWSTEYIARADNHVKQWGDGQFQSLSVTATTGSDITNENVSRTNVEDFDSLEYADKIKGREKNSMLVIGRKKKNVDRNSVLISVYFSLDYRLKPC